MQAPEAIQQAEANRTAIDTVDVIVGVLLRENVQCVNTGAVISQQAVTDPDNGH